MSQTCSHIYDTGGICQSFAVREQRYCVHHLRFRARRLRIAQARARGERFEFNLPPLESMHAVQTALSQIAEAIAAGVIDSRSAHLLLSVLRVASRNLLQPDKWRDSLYHSDQPAPDIDVAAEFGLPSGLDLDTLPSVILSESRADESKDPFVANAPTAAPELPFSGNYCGTHHSRECECCRIRPGYPVTPEAIEYTELRDSQGPDVAYIRAKQLERNRERRRLNSQRKRYEAIALEHNMRRAAEKMADLKFAALQSEHPSDEPSAPPKPPASDSASPTQTGEKSALTPTG